MPRPATTSTVLARKGPTADQTADPAVWGIPKRSKGLALRLASWAEDPVPWGPEPDALPDAPRTAKSPVPQPDEPTAAATWFSEPLSSAARIPEAKGSSRRAAVAWSPVDQSEKLA